MIKIKHRWDNEEFLEARAAGICACPGGGGGGGSTPPPPPPTIYPPQFEEPGPSESEIALGEIAAERYERFKEYYVPVEDKFLEEQDKDKSYYAKMMAAADAQQATKAPAQIDASSGRAAKGIADLRTAGARGAAAGAGAAYSADFQRRNGNKMWALAGANKLTSNAQTSLGQVANAASSAALSTANQVNSQNIALQNQAFSNQLNAQMMQYNYQQRKIQNVVNAGATAFGMMYNPTSPYMAPSTSSGVQQQPLVGSAPGTQNNQWWNSWSSNF
ncbi:MAG: hypothetical protein VW443_05220 [Pseudomonadales bacterium]